MTIRTVRYAAVPLVLFLITATLTVIGPAHAARASLPAPQQAGKAGASIARQPLREPVWLCKPGLPNNPCNQNARGNPIRPEPFTASYPVSDRQVPLNTTVVDPLDGSTDTRDFHRPADPKVDCFYVYPTVDLVANPLLQVGSRPPRPTDTELAASLSQVGPMLSNCRMFIPVYRQKPLPAVVTPALLGGRADYSKQAVDIVQAWDRYWANDNRDPETGKRRGVVLLGHSQGSQVLKTLIQQRIDGRAAQRQLVSAVLLGGDVTVPTGETAGGGDALSSFQHLPVCTRSAADASVPTGCVVAYSSYNLPEGSALPKRAAFGRAPEGHTVACTNPAALLQDETADSERAVEAQKLTTTARPHPLLAGLKRNRPDFPTGYAAYPGAVQVRCASTTDDSGTGHWLEVDDPGELFGPPSRSRGGLHVSDYSVTLGTLTTLISAQSRAWQPA